MYLIFIEITVFYLRFFDFLPFSKYIPTKAKKKMRKDVEFTKELTEKIIRSQQKTGDAS